MLANRERVSNIRRFNLSTVRSFANGACDFRFFILFAKEDFLFERVRRLSVLFVSSSRLFHVRLFRGLSLKLPDSHYFRALAHTIVNLGLSHVEGLLRFLGDEVLPLLVVP